MPCVMIIDDDQFQRDVLEKLVRTLGYEPQVFQSKQDAQRALTTAQSPAECNAAFPLNPQNHTGYSAAWQHIVREAARAADSTETLIIEGEAGTGKSTLAQALHYHSTRAHKPLVYADTSQDVALLNTVLEAAAGGTLVVRHYGRAPEAFLRGIERLYRTFVTPGTKLILCHQLQNGEAPLPTHAPLPHLTLPPLRQRPQDVVMLAETFLQRAGSWLGRTDLRLSAEAGEHIRAYQWPGNIRQLHAELFNAALHSTGGEILHLEGTARDGSMLAAANDTATCKPTSIALLDEEGNLRSLEDMEAEIIQFALTHFPSSRSDIAKMLGIGRTTLYRKAHQLHS